MEPSDLTVYTSPFPKKRIGRNYDGGYIIAEIPGVEYNLLLSGGICDDISFEEEFINKYPCICLAFDGTINGISCKSQYIKFIKKNIGFSETEQETNLHDVINANSSIFLKMDIEGAEIPWLKSLSEEHMHKLKQIVIEFHFPFTDKEKDIFKTINKTHYLVHLHTNNCCGIRNYKRVNMPNVFECTYIHKEFFTEIPSLNTSSIPSDIDMPNVRSRPDIGLNHSPFVNNY